MDWDSFAPIYNYLANILIVDDQHVQIVGYGAHLFACRADRIESRGQLAFEIDHNAQSV